MKEMKDSKNSPIEQQDDVEIITPEQEKTASKFKTLMESGANAQTIRKVLGVSAQLISQVFGYRVSKHDNKKRTTNKRRKAVRNAQKQARRSSRGKNQGKRSTR